MTDLPAAGVLVVDKAEGWTSHDVVATLRRVLGTRRVGHGGTLDPLATGVLPVLFGSATRLAEHLHRAAKAYLAEIVLGAETSTDDREGEPTERAPVPMLDDERVRDVFRAFEGRQRQRPPAFSSRRVGGVPAHRRARRGERVELAAREVEIHELLFVDRGERCVHFLVTCSGGTYVRALARDLGRALGTRAHLGALRRVAAGGFFVEDAVTVEQVRELASSGALAPLVHAADTSALDVPGAILAREAARRLLSGGRAPLHRPADGPVRLYDESGLFLGIGEAGDGEVRPHTILATGEADARGPEGR